MDDEQQTPKVNLDLLVRHESDHCAKCPNGLTDQCSPENTYGGVFSYRNLSDEQVAVQPLDKNDEPYPTEFLVVTCRSCGWQFWRPCNDNQPS
jgi:hypothetical protein